MDTITKDQLKCLATLVSKLAWSKEEKMYWVNHFSDSRETSSKYLSKLEAAQMIEFLIDKFNNTEKTNIMPQRMYGSLNLTKLLEKAKEGHSAFRRAESNNNIYVNVTQWINDEKDAKGNDSAITLSSTKEAKETEGKVYIGNLKKADGGYGNTPISAKAPGNEDLNGFNPDDLPF